MKKSKMKKSNYWVICLVILSSVFLVIVYGKVGNIWAITKNVGTPRLSFIGGEPSLVSLIPEQTSEYRFKISNVKDLQRSDASLRYFFDFSYQNIDSGKDLDVSYDLFYQPTPTSQLIPVGMQDLTRSNPITISHTEENTHILVLKVTWNGTQRDPVAFSKKTGKILIDTYVEQIIM